VVDKQKRELGEQLVERMFGGAANRPGPDWAPEPHAYLQQFTAEEIFGGLWQRSALDVRTRSLITLACLVSLGRSARSIRLHVRGALANGATEAEITEVLVHTSFYAGAPVLSEAMPVALEVLRERQEPGEAAPDPAAGAA
jgi:4-carboxymuconolactone decarboxylase